MTNCPLGRGVSSRSSMSSSRKQHLCLPGVCLWLSLRAGSGGKGNNGIRGVVAANVARTGYPAKPPGLAGEVYAYPRRKVADRAESGTGGRLFWYGCVVPEERDATGVSG